MLFKHTSLSGYVYLLGNRKLGWYKIGMARNPDARVKQLGVLLPFSVELFAVWRTCNRSQLEAAMHVKYSASHLNGEWFCFEPLEVLRVIDSSQPHDALRVFPERAGQSRSVCSSGDLVMTAKKPLPSPIGKFEAEQLRQKQEITKDAYRRVVEMIRGNGLPLTKRNKCQGFKALQHGVDIMTMDVQHNA